TRLKTRQYRVAEAVLDVEEAARVDVHLRISRERLQPCDIFRAQTVGNFPLRDRGGREHILIEFQHQRDIRVRLGLRVPVQRVQQKLNVLPAVENVVAASRADQSIGEQLRNFGAAAQVIDNHGVINVFE